VTQASDYGREWGVHHYGIEGHREDKADDDEWAAELLKGGEVPSWPSGELVAPLLGAIVEGKHASLPMNLPNSGQVKELPAGVVVECIGETAEGAVRPRDVASAGAAAWHLSRVVESQELTVEASLKGDRNLVLRAMLADPVAGSLPFEHVAALTDEMLAATSPWLPQFS
jgi:alpha-galactosidase/6-phospho-beta-glucosidase family protein